MAVSLATIASEVVAQLNLAPTYTTTPIDPRACAGMISDAVLNADGAVIEAILANPLNGQRMVFIQSITVAHASTLPARIGPIDAVIVGGKAAQLWDRSEIENERTNRLSLTSINPHYALDGNVLYHNGASAATVKYFTYTRTAACQAPDEYYYSVLCGALAEIASIEGENDGLAAFYGAQFQKMLEAIRGGQSPPPFQQA